MTVQRSSQIYIGIIVLQFIIIVSLAGLLFYGPSLTTGESVHLPRTDTSSDETTPETFTIHIRQGGEIFINQDRVVFEAIPGELQKKLPGKFDTRIYLRAEYGSDYGVVMKVMASINAAGFSNIGLVTNPAVPFD